MTINGAIKKGIEDKGFTDVVVDYEMDGGYLVNFVTCKKDGIEAYAQICSAGDLEVGCIGDYEVNFLYDNDDEEVVKFNLEEV